MAWLKKRVRRPSDEYWDRYGRDPTIPIGESAIRNREQERQRLLNHQQFGTDNPPDPNSVDWSKF